MNLHLENKIIIVTEGAKGIGEGITRMLAEEGAIPIIIGRNEENNRKLANEILNSGKKADYFTAELIQPEECKKATWFVVEKYQRIDGLVNNAGINDGVELAKGSYEDFMQSLHHNLVHYYLMAHHALPFLIQSKGSIVNIGSKTAETGQGNTSAYAAANGGRNALTREWAVELLPHKVRVNAVIVSECWAPLYENRVNTFSGPEAKLKSITGDIPLEKRMTTAKGIASMVAFLLSKPSSHTTGQLIHVDGGYTHLDRVIS